MGQLVFRQGSYEVLTGWDRPLQYFFLVIESDEDRKRPDGHYTFSNLNRRNPSMTLAEIQDTLESWLIVSPPTLFADLERERERNESNTCYRYPD